MSGSKGASVVSARGVSRPEVIHPGTVVVVAAALWPHPLTSSYVAHTLPLTPLSVPPTPVTPFVCAWACVAAQGRSGEARVRTQPVVRCRGFIDPELSCARTHTHRCLHHARTPTTPPSSLSSASLTCAQN